jgi:hypothetical protein
MLASLLCFMLLHIIKVYVFVLFYISLLVPFESVIFFIVEN